MRVRKVIIGLLAMLANITAIGFLIDQSDKLTNTAGLPLLLMAVIGFATGVIMFVEGTID